MADSVRASALILLCVVSSWQRERTTALLEHAQDHQAIALPTDAATHGCAKPYSPGTASRTRH
jgi:hypothetical protein